MIASIFQRETLLLSFVLLLALLASGCEGDPIDLRITDPRTVIEARATSASPAGATITFSDPTFTYDSNDVINVAFEVTSEPASGSFFPVGVHTLRWRVQATGKKGTLRSINDTAEKMVIVKVAPVESPDCPPTPPAGGATGFQALGSFGASGNLRDVEAPLSLVEGCDEDLYGVTKTVFIDYSRAIVRLKKDGSSANSIVKFGGTQAPPLDVLLPQRFLARTAAPDVGGVRREVFIGTSAHAQNSEGVIFAVWPHDGRLETLVEATSGTFPFTGVRRVAPGLAVDQAGFVHGFVSAAPYLTWATPGSFAAWNEGQGFPGDPVGLDVVWGPVFGSDGLRARQFFAREGFESTPPTLWMADIDGGDARAVAEFTAPDWRGPDDELTTHRGGLLAASDGNLYGTFGTSLDYALTNPNLTFAPYIFKFIPSPAGGTLEKVASFALNQTFPWQQLVESRGYVYGFLVGAKFELIRFRLGSTTIETVHTFAADEMFDSDVPIGEDSPAPAGALWASPDGAIYGTAPKGGSEGKGFFWRYLPEVAPAPRKTPALAAKFEAPKPPVANAVDPNSILPESENGRLAGRSVAVDGDWMAVGVPAGREDSFAGEVLIYKKAATAWALHSTLTPPVADNAKLFGHSVALRDNLVAIGAPGGFRQTNLWGFAYIFRRDDDTWSLEQRIASGEQHQGDEYGASIALGSNNGFIYTAVGAPANNRKADRGGSVFVFKKTGFAFWQSYSTTLAGDGAAGDLFGASVAFGGGQLLVGAPRGDIYSLPRKPGAAYLFSDSGSAFDHGLQLDSPRNYTGDLFGSSVAAGDGFFVVGQTGLLPRDANDPDRYMRAVYLFTNSFAPQIPLRLAPAAPLAEEMFGAHLSVTGHRIVVGAPRAPAGLANPAAGGGLYVFDKVSEKWWLNTRVTSDQPAPFDGFGLVTAAQGPTVVASAIGYGAAGRISFAEIPVLLQPPARLKVSRAGPVVRIEWDAEFSDFILESKTSLGSSGWIAVTPPPIQQIHETSPADSQQFFRLRKP